MVNVPGRQEEDLYEEMVAYINQHENEVIESLKEPNSIWNLVNGLFMPGSL